MDASVIRHVLECFGSRTAQIFPARAGCSPERTAGQTACPEEFSARARKVCDELKGAGLGNKKGTSKVGCAEEGKMRSGTSLSSCAEMTQKEMGGTAAKEERSWRRDADKDYNSHAVQRGESGSERLELHSVHLKP